MIGDMVYCQRPLRKMRKDLRVMAKLAKVFNFINKYDAAPHLAGGNSVDYLIILCISD